MANCNIERGTANEIVNILGPDGKSSLLYSEIHEYLKENKEYLKRAIEDPYVQEMTLNNGIKGAEPSEVALALWNKTYTDNVETWFRKAPKEDRHPSGEPKMEGKFEKLINNGEEEAYIIEPEDPQEFIKGEVLTLNDIILGSDSQREKRKKMRLYQILNNAGISIMSMDNYLKSVGQTLSTGVDHLADTVNSIIAVSEGRLTSDKLAEEVGHMIMPNFKNTAEYNRASRLVQNTAEYESESEKYRAKYTEDNPEKSETEIEDMVREEILGQILGKNIINQISREGDFALMRTLRKLWNKFLSIFDSHPHIKQFIEDIGRKAANMSIEAVQKSKNKLYSIGAHTKEHRTLEKIIRNLKKRLTSLQRRQLEEEALVLKEHIAELENDLEQAEIEKGLLRFMSIAKEAALKATDYIEEVLGSGNTGAINPTKLMHLSDFYAYYQPFMENLKSAKKYRGAFKHIGSEDFMEDMDNLVSAFSDIKSFLDEFIEEEAINILEKFFSEKLKIPLDDPMFYEKVKNITNYDYKAEIAETRKNSNFMEYWFGAAKDASDQLIRIIYTMVAEVQQMVNDSTLDFGKNLIDLAEKYNMTNKNLSWMLSKTNDKFNGYWLENVRRADFEEAKKDHFTSIREKYAKIIKAKRLSDDPKVLESQLESYKKGLHAEYKKDLSEWFKKNTENIPDADKIYYDMARKYKLGEITEAEWREFQDAVLVRKGTTKGGKPFAIYKGFLAMPSRGTMKLDPFSGATFKTKNWSDKNYDSLSKEEIAFLEAVKKIKADIDEKLPGNKYAHNKYAPQLSESLLDVVYRKNKGLFRKLGRVVSDAVITKVDDEQYFGNSVEKRPDGTTQRYVPLFFRNLLGGKSLSREQRLLETDKISTDIIGSIAAYYRMANNFHRMSALAPKVNLMQEQAARREVKTNPIWGKEKITAGSQSWGFKKLDNFLEMNVYGRNKQLLEWKVPYIKDKHGREVKVNITKLMNALQRYIRAVNLGMNMATSFSNFAQSLSFSKLEDYVGEFTTRKSKNFAQIEWLKQSHKLLNEPLSINKGNKLYLIMEKMGLANNIYDAFRNVDKSRLTKKAVESGLFWSYEITDFFVKGQAVIAALDNYRIHNGKFYTKLQYDQLKGEKPDYYDLKSAYELIDVEKNRIKTSIDEKEFRRIIMRGTELANRIDGRLGQADYAAAHQSAIMQLMTTHRGWMFSGIQKRFKSMGYNFLLDQMDGGYYTMTGKWIGSLIFGTEKVRSLQALIQNYKNLDPVMRSAVKRALMEQIVVMLSASLAWGINAAASGEKDDEYLWELSAYLSNRVVMENGAFGIVPLPLMFQELSTSLRDPLVPLRQTELIFELHEALPFFGGNETVERGVWKGYTRRARAIGRLLPVYKSAMLFNDPESTNEFLKNKPLRMMYR